MLRYLSNNAYSSSYLILLGNYFEHKFEVLKIRRFDEEGSRRGNYYIFFFENRPLRTLYGMKDDPSISFDKEDLKYHIHLYFESLKEMIEEDEAVRDIVQLVLFKYEANSLNFTKDLTRSIDSILD